MSEHTTAEFYDGGVVVITLSPSPTSDDLSTRFLGPLNALLDSEKHFSVIVDSTRVESVDVALTKMVISWLRSNRKRFKKYLRCSSIIVAGTLIRNILDIVFRVQTPVAPMKVVSNTEDAWGHVVLIEKTQDKVRAQLP